MARCESIDVLQQIKLDGEMAEVESSESDLEIDVSRNPDIVDISHSPEPDTHEGKEDNIHKVNDKKGGTKCIMCGTRAFRSHNIKFHRFPRNQEMSDKWAQKISLNFVLNASADYRYAHYRICSQHFVEEDYSGKSKRFLRDTAVPRKNENFGDFNILSLQRSLKEKLSSPMIPVKPNDLRSPKESEDFDLPLLSSTGSLENIWNEKKISVGPVISLKCLHGDSINEVNDCTGNTECSTNAKVEFIDINDVPELSIDSDQEEKEANISNHKSFEEKEEHPHLVPLTIDGKSSTFYQIAVPPCSSVPARNNWEGVHNFKIKIDCFASRKSEHVIFAESLNKLYITKDYPFKVLVSAENVPMDSVIRVTAVFSLVEHSYETVQRCPTHAQQDYLKGIACYEHFVQCFSDAAVYEKNHKTGKLNVSVLYKKPQEGETYSAYLFKLTCFSSCSGGINRRPFMLMFTLEKDNIPLGRRVIKAKVCACPLRDYKLEIRKQDNNDTSNINTSNANTSNNISNSTSFVPESSESNPEKTTQTYSIAVKDLELYLFLERMKTLYEISASQVMSDS